ncbi:Hypothetical predicted protein, partial [Mytilus galloprovincialis]
VEYEIPDQVWSIVNTLTGWLHSYIEILNTRHAVKKSMARKVDVRIGEGMFSASGSYKTFQDYLTNSPNQGQFGGLLRRVLTTDQSYYQGRTDTQLNAQASATFFKIIKLDGGGSSRTQTVNSKFTEVTQKSVR